MQGPKEIGDIDTDDDKDEEEQYEQWKTRELQRIRYAGQGCSCTNPPLPPWEHSFRQLPEVSLQVLTVTLPAGVTSAGAICHALERSRTLSWLSLLRIWMARLVGNLQA